MELPVKSADLERWAPDALALPAPKKYSVPFTNLLDEAVEAADFVTNYWDPVVDGAVARPGLSSVAGQGGAGTLHPGYADELRSLQRAAADAQANYIFAAKLDASPIERARYVLRELRSALHFLFDDGVTDESDQRLTALAAEHGSHPSSLAKVALALDGYANLAALHRDALEALATFDPALIEEARVLSERLRARTSTPIVTTQEARATLELRERYATLIADRLRALRHTAEYLFRDHPAIYREVTSAYERRKRATTRGGPVAESPEGMSGADAKATAEMETESAE